MLISLAHAQSSGGGGGFDILQLAPLILIFVVFYFLLIRPQQKKAKDHREMIGKMRRGDKVLTGGGIYGKVTKIVDENSMQVEIADGVKVQVAKGTVASVIDRADPPAENSNEKKADS